MIQDMFQSLFSPYGAWAAFWITLAWLLHRAGRAGNYKEFGMEHEGSATSYYELLRRLH